MSDEHRSLDKKIRNLGKTSPKKEKAERERRTRILVYSIGGGLALLGLILTAIGAALSGNAHTLLLVFGLLMLVGGGITCVTQIMPAIRFSRRVQMRFKDNSVQLVDNRGKVTAQIPFVNIASAELEGREVQNYRGFGRPPQWSVLEVTLIDPEDEDTFWPWPWKSWCDRKKDYDIEINDKWEYTLAKIRTVLKEGSLAVAKHRKRRD